MTQQEIDNIIISYLSREDTDEEKNTLFTWINEHEDNKQYFFRYKTIWNQSSVAASDIDIDIHKKWVAIHKKASGITTSIYTALKIAAVIVIAIAIGSLITLFLNKQALTENMVYNETVVPYGGGAQVILSDGSRVILNAGSKLKYPTQFLDKQREVFLEGEAFFEVKTDKKSPFIVKTEDLNVKAFGTKFNVNAYADEPVITATLVEGEIAVSSMLSGAEEVYLKPSETATYYKKSYELAKSDQNKSKSESRIETSTLKKAKSKEITVLTQVNTEVYTSWKDNKWIIEGEKLESLAKKLERRFDIEISFKNNELKGFRFTGRLEDEPVEQVLQVMKLTAPLEYEIKGRNVIIKLDSTIKNYNEIYSN